MHKRAKAEGEHAAALAKIHSVTVREMAGTGTDSSVIKVTFIYCLLICLGSEGRRSLKCTLILDCKKKKCDMSGCIHKWNKLSALF